MKKSSTKTYSKEDIKKFADFFLILKEIDRRLKKEDRENSDEIQQDSPEKENS